MMSSTYFPKWLILLALAILALSPTEATLGANVRIVYLHVALTRTGLAGMALAGVIGLALLAGPLAGLAGPLAGLAGPKAGLNAWADVLSRVGLGFYVAGFAVSFVAQLVIWGGFAIQEPRTQAALDVLAVAAIVQVLLVWFKQPRIHGGLHVAMALVVTWGLITAENVLHPQAAISSGAASIKFYAYALLAVCMVAAGWIAWTLRRTSSTGVPAREPARAG